VIAFEIRYHIQPNVIILFSFRCKKFLSEPDDIINSCNDYSLKDIHRRKLKFAKNGAFPFNSNLVVQFIPQTKIMAGLCV